MAGSTTFPTSVDNKTAIVDGVDFMEADNVNNAYVPMTATQTFIGANGKGASWSSDILDYLGNTKAPIVTKASSNTLSVSAGTVFVKNSGQSNRLMRRNTIATTVTASDIDTGSLATNTMYYVFAVGDTAATTFTVKFSLSSTSPTGLTNFELIGWFYNETAGAILLTNGYVGNVKSGNRDVPNAGKLTSATDSSTTSTSFTDAPETTLQFYSSGRPVLVYFKSITVGDANNQGARAIFNLDGSDVTNSDMREVSATVATADAAANRPSVAGFFIAELAAGAHTLKMRYATTAGTTHLHQRQTGWIEL